MASMFEPVKAVLTPEMFAKVGERLGLPGEQVQKGVEIAVPLLTRGIAGVAATPEGQVAIADAIKQADTGVLGNLSGHMGSFTQEAGGDVLMKLFGDEGRVVSGTIKQATGFDISPILGMAGPLLLGFLGSTAQKEGLDTNGLVKKLKQEARSFDRQKGEAAVLVDNVLGKVDEVRQLKASFSAADWATMRNGPMAAAAAISAAAPSKAAVMGAEMAAALASLPEATRNAGPTSLIAALFHNGVEGIATDGYTDPMAAVRQATALVKRHAPAEAPDYNKVVMNAAYAAAQGAKEGGFLGMGAKVVSKEEQGAIDALASALSI